MKSNAEKNIGKIFGKLIIVSRVDNDKNGRTRVLCHCECGNKKEIRLKDILNGKIKSCGCLQFENRYRTHEMTHTTEYSIWANMITRCTNKKVNNYKNYGGRGISVCDRWLKSFQNFFEDMGNRPSMSLTLDRVNNDGNYEPTNCRWATKKQQSANKRISINERRYTHNGINKNLKAWAKELGINYNTLHDRINFQKRSFIDSINPVPVKLRSGDTGAI